MSVGLDLVTALCECCPHYARTGCRGLDCQRCDECRKDDAPSDEERCPHIVGHVPAPGDWGTS